MDTLLVEDNAAFRQAIKEILVSKFPSMRIDEAAEGKEAFRRMRSHLPDIIFLDVRLPGENGLELTKKIKAQYPNVVIIILTNYNLPEYRDAAYGNGADYFLIKSASSATEIVGLVESIHSGSVNDSTGKKST